MTIQDTTYTTMDIPTSYHYNTIHFIMLYFDKFETILLNEVFVTIAIIKVEISVICRVEAA